MAGVAVVRGALDGPSGAVGIVNTSKQHRQSEQEEISEWETHYSAVWGHKKHLDTRRRDSSFTLFISKSSKAITRWFEFVQTRFWPLVIALEHQTTFIYEQRGSQICWEVPLQRHSVAATVKTLPGRRPRGLLQTLSCCVPAVQFENRTWCTISVFILCICFCVSNWFYRAAVCEVPMNSQYSTDKQMHTSTETDT